MRGLIKYYLLMLIFTAYQAHADLTVFDVRKSLPLSDQEPVYRDFYINGGTEAGLANGMIIVVQRRLPLYDSYQNRSAGDLQLKVAKIKIIHTQKGLAVARLYSEFTRDTAPLLEDNFIMVGDQLDLATATSEKKAEIDEQSRPVASASSDTPANSADFSSEAPKAPMATPQGLNIPVLQ